MTIHDAKALIALCIDEGLKQGVLKNKGEFEELFDYLDKCFADTDKMINGSSEIPKDLEEASDEFANQDCVTFISRKKGFIARAKWQADHAPLPEDTVIYQRGVEEGKRLMMEEAVEYELYYDGDFLAIDLNMAELGYSERDKVRVIIIPNTDEK